MSAAESPNRREFLSGGAVLRAAQEAAQRAALAHDPTAAHEKAVCLLHVGRSAMACQFEIYLIAGRPPLGPDIALQALDLVDQLEAQLTVYRPHSEISHLNRSAGEAPIPVEGRLFQLLLQAQQLHADTDGAFDITAGCLSKVWGFYRREGRVPESVELEAALERVGSQHLDLEPNLATVRFRQSGLEINLGAIGKGYALDRSAEFMLAEGVPDFLIHGGTSSILARGSRGAANDDPSGWSVALKHPLRSEERLAEIWLRDQALGTSGAGNQFFFHRGQRYGHILDPRTGRPASGVLSSTVIASSAARADALSTAFYVGGLSLAQSYCDAHPEVSALLITPADRAGEVELHRFNFTPDQQAGVSN
ncbi:MAG: FAD:protein FMN transferase [Planctomycetota bacterium]